MKSFTFLYLIVTFSGTLFAGSHSLFNGKISMAGRSKMEVSSRLSRGTSASIVGWLRSEETYGDFTLVIEFRRIDIVRHESA